MAYPYVTDQPIAPPYQASAQQNQLQQPNSFNNDQPSTYGQQQPGAYGQQPGAYGQQPGAYGQQPGAYGQQPGAYGQQPGAYGQQPGAYGQQPGAYGQQQPWVQGQMHNPQPAYGAPVIAAYLPGGPRTLRLTRLNSYGAPYIQQQQIFVNGIVVDQRAIVLNRLRRGGIAFLTSGIIFIIVAIVLTASYKPSCSSSVCSYSLYYWWWFVIGGLFIGIGARNLIMARRLEQQANALVQ